MRYHIIRLVVGIVLILAALFFLSTAVYMFKNNSKQAANPEDNTNSPVDELLKLDIESNKAQEIHLGTLLNEAKAVYDEDERNRNQGLLWVDGKTSKLIVTLGILHGLKQGSLLTVYNDEGKMGEVIVDTALDVISYVRPVNKDMTIYRDEYYRVVIE